MFDFFAVGRQTGGHFACACVQPLYKEGVIAVIKMAREIQIVLFMFIFLVLQKSAQCVERLLLERTDGLLLNIRKIFYLASASMRTLTGKYVDSAGKP